MKLYLFGRLFMTAWYCQHLLVGGVSAGGDEEEQEKAKLRRSAVWLDAFYSNIDNVLTHPTLTVKASDVPDLPAYVPSPSNSTQDEPRPINELPPERVNGRNLGRLQQDQLQGQAATILFNGEGIPFQGVAPPDTVGDVGTDHYVQSTNSGAGAVVRILNKIDGSLNKTFILDSLSMGVGFCAGGLGDPIVLFDQLASRWFLAEFASAGDRLCVYISTSDDATGTYFAYPFATPNFPDYPKFGVWNDAYYVGTNEGDLAMYALQRSQMLLGLPAVIVRNVGPPALDFLINMIPPVDADGDLAPPTGPGIYVRHVDDELHSAYPNNPAHDLFEIHTLAVNFAMLTATRTLIQTVEVAEFDSTVCGTLFEGCVPQPSTTVKLFPIREFVMNRPQYRNFGTHESIVATWVVDAVPGTNRHGVRWLELRKQAGASSWVVHQQNTFSPDATNRWMSSGMMNGCGDIAIGYSVSSSTVRPGIRVTGRLSGDPLNQMDAETSIVAGVGSSNIDRWGDYSAMAVDPIDDATFWYTNEYIPTSNGLWSTRIAKFTLGSAACSSSTTPSPMSQSPTTSPGPNPEKSTCGIVRQLLGIC
jgi:hypothetical protein